MRSFFPRRPLILAAALSLITLTASCDTAEERAEEHYQNGLALLQAGDIPRARVEFQTVFKFNGDHRDARAALASLLRDEGNISGSFGQYLRLIEQYPDDVEARLNLAEMAAEIARRNQDWEMFDTQLEPLKTLAPDEPRTRVLMAMQDYRAAVLDDDAAARREAADRAVALKAELPESVLNRTVIIDNLILDGDFGLALVELDEAQELDPEDRQLFRMRLTINSRQGDDDGLEQTLRRMVRTFPDDQSVADTMIGFYSTRGDAAGAEAFLRERIIGNEKNDDARTALIRFVTQIHGLEAAIEEATRFVDEGTNDPLFRSMRAALRFDLGETDAAIGELEDVLAGAEPDALTNDIKVTLARILLRTGNEVGARAEIEEVLENDPGMVDALQMKAAWLIAADDTDAAILLLRRARDQEPENPDVLTTMAQAYLRNGERELAGETLAEAVEAANSAPPQSLTYARFLSDEQRFSAAEGVLIEALRLQPGNINLLAELGRVYVGLQDWSRAEQVENSLRDMQTDAATSVADRIRVAILQSQQRDSDAIAFLQTLAEGEGDTRSAEVAIVRAHIDRGDPDAAIAYLESLLEEEPEDPNLRFLFAAVSAGTGDLETAEALYRELIDDGQAGERVWLELARLLTATGRTDEAEALVEKGLEVIPESADMLWLRATFLERSKDYEGAIAVYQTLYDRNSSTSIVANNLASLLSTARDDDESLEQAWRIARRLRESDFPPFQDTYGWIAYRRGDYEDALRHLQPAAAGLPQDAMVQYHLGMALTKLERTEEAIAQLEKALEIAGDDARPQFETARTTLAELRNRGNPAPTSPDAVETLPQNAESGVENGGTATE